MVTFKKKKQEKKNTSIFLSGVEFKGDSMKCDSAGKKAREALLESSSVL